MRKCLKSLMLLAGLAMGFAATSREAVGRDRFDVNVTLVSFKSLHDMDPSEGNANDEYFITMHSDVMGAGRRSILNLEKDGPANKVLYVGRTVRFQNIREPDRDNRAIYLMADVSEEDVVQVGNILKKKTETKYANMGVASGVTRGDLFKEADRSDNDQASQTITILNKNYRMEIRVVVVKAD